MPVVKKTLLKILILFFLCLFTTTAYADDESDEDGKPSVVPGYSMGSIRALFHDITKTGAGFESTPAIDRPQFVTVSDASLSMNNEEYVFIVEYPDGTVRIYPQRILVWHEVINDVLPQKGSIDDTVYAEEERSDRRYTLTYSPTTGSVVGFKSTAGRFPSSFGSAGDFLNGNPLLYDRASHTIWSQLLAVSIDGALVNKRLERIPVLWATWRGAKKRYLGRAEVLSRSTGFKRPYGRDPYGSYQTRGNYYDNTVISAPVSKLDKRLHPKKRILGIEYGDMYAAVQVDAVKQAKVLNFAMGINPMVAIYDEELDAIRIFDRRINAVKDAEPLSFKIFENELVDTATNSHWNVEGIGTYGQYRDTQLVPIYAIDSMWFAWAAFHRETIIIP